MREYKLNGKIVGVVEVPTDCMQTYIHHYGFLLYNTKKEFNLTIDLPEGNWQILSLASEMTEEQSNTLGMTLQQFKEWLKSEQYVVYNEFGKYPTLNDYYISNASQDYMDGLQMEIGLMQARWQEAQKLVQNFLIIVKEK